MNLKQGDIIAFNFSPTAGHEQSGYRPAVVVSRNIYNNHTGQVVVCPITNTNKQFPMRVALDGRIATTGFVICEQVRTIDVNARKPKFVEQLPEDLLQQVLDLIVSIFEGY